MVDKFEVYDLFGIFIPGVLVIYAFAICFPGSFTFAPRMGDALGVIVFVAGAMFVGELAQAISSTLEPALFYTFGGRPSDQALHSGLGERYLPAKTAERIRSKLMGAIGSHVTKQDLFIYALQRAEATNSARINKFSAVYAYHRVLMICVLCTTIMFITSGFIGSLAGTSRSIIILIVIVSLAVLVLVWNRTRQRSFYYVREVLMTAERVLDGGSVRGSSLTSLV